ncbi:hypothetical protein OBE_07471, partial [human gut metagenome]
EKALSAFENNEFLCRLTDLLLNRKKLTVEYNPGGSDINEN